MTDVLNQVVQCCFGLRKFVEQSKPVRYVPSDLPIGSKHTMANDPAF